MPYIDHVSKNNERIEIISKPLSDSIADEFSEGMAYSVGDVVMHEGGLYEFKTAHSAGAWNQNQVDAVNINDKIDNKLNEKIDFPPENKFGTNGQILSSKGNGETEWVDFGLPSDEQTWTAISSWLDEHPEAITSVADNSITSKKFHGNIPFYNVVDYGIVPNSNEDQYDAIQDLLVNYVYNTGGIVYFPKGKYITSYTIFIPENTTFLGAGVDTEIYFDESDRYFSTALSNAGSNVTIKNMKVSQATTGMFHAGAQPGCIGFSDIAKEQVLKRNEHSVVRDNVYNLVAENLYFGGFYAIQTENSASGFIRNVTYRNLYCPDSCVSIMANNFIENVVVENIHCDLLRAWDTATNDYRVYMNNVLVNNVYFQKCYIFTNPRFETNITFNNLKQTDLERKNDRTAASNCGVVSGNVEFNNCTFTAIEAEINGLYLQNGIRKFNNCIFDMQAKITTRGASLNDNNDYDVFNNCTFISKEVPSGYLMIGYGRNNTYCDGIRNLIWGDMHKTYQTPVASPDTDIVNYLCVNETSLKLLVHFNVSSTEHLFKLSSKFNNLDISNNVFPVTLWNTQTGLIVFTFAKIENGYCDIADAEYAGLNEFDCGTIDTELMLNERPSITAIYQLFS